MTYELHSPIQSYNQILTYKNIKFLVLVCFLIHFFKFLFSQIQNYVFILFLIKRPDFIIIQDNTAHKSSRKLISLDNLITYSYPCFYFKTVFGIYSKISDGYMLASYLFLNVFRCLYLQSISFPSAFDRLHCHLQRAKENKICGDINSFHHFTPQPAKTFPFLSISNSSA